MLLKRNSILVHWPLLLSMLLYGALLVGLTYKVIARCDSTFVYAIDDPYIHMAMAKNLARSGVWGVTRFEFSASSSSPLWTLLLAFLFVLFGVYATLPFILNILIGAILLTLTHFVTKRFISSKILLFGFLLLFILAVPIPVIAFFGMEHLLQIVVDLLFILYLASLLVQMDEPRSSQVIGLALLAALCTLVRYEGMFIILLSVLLAVLRKRIRLALVIALSGFAPIILIGLWYVWHGWAFFPNSVLLKGSVPTLGSGYSLLLKWMYSKAYAYRFPDYSTTTYLPLLFVALLLIIVYNWAHMRSIYKDVRLLLGILVSGVILLHVMFADIVNYFRYDAYLAALALIAVVSNLQLAGGFFAAQFLSSKGYGYYINRACLLVAALYLVLPLLNRGGIALRDTPTYAKNIYQQQVQMAFFLKTYFSGETIVANDIGAISFFDDIRLVDLWGLASIEQLGRCGVDPSTRNLSAASPGSATERLRLSTRNLLTSGAGCQQNGRWLANG